MAAQLDAHPAVATVYYPGLVSHPGHALAARQQKGFGAMLSVELGGDGAAARESAVRAFLDGLQCFPLADSLGGVESLVAQPEQNAWKRDGEGKGVSVCLVQGCQRCI